MRNVLVTGSSGYLGHHLVEALQGSYDVTGAYASHPVAFARAASVKLELRDMENCRRVMDESAPHCVVHTAAMSQTADCEKNSDAAFAVNAIGTANLAAACSALDPCPHLIYISTDLVFDGSRGQYSEDDKPCPIQIYGTSKLRGEDYVRLYRGSWTILRSALIYGAPLPGRRCFLDWTLEGIRAGTFSFFEDEYRCPVCVNDLCTAIATVIETRNNGVYHIGGPKRLSRYDFAKLTSTIFFNNQVNIKSAKLADAEIAKTRPADVSMDISKARNDLQFSPLPPEEALRQIHKQHA